MNTTEILAEQLHHFCQAVSQEIPPLLGYYQARTDAGGICFVDQPGKPRRIRPWCDAVEIGAAFGLSAGHFTRREWIAALRDFQNPETGLVPEHIPDDRHLNPPPAAQGTFEDRYNTMIVSYALECLGSSLAHPVKSVEDIGSEIPDSLDWISNGWSAGSWVDSYASCLYVNRRYFSLGRQIDPLLAWLDSHCDPTTGVWSEWRKEDRWLLPVNGFYRLTRGTYAQFGRPLPHPDKALDTILLHAADPFFFEEGRGNACNVLDIVHPLWLCLKQTSHRAEEAGQWVLSRLPEILNRWVPERGFAFDPIATTEQGQPSLQGTEMWLSIVYLMATITDLAQNLAFRPRGVHRLPPALIL